MTFDTGAIPGTKTISSTLLALPVMVLAVDENGLFVAWNSECERITGYKAAEIIGHPNPSLLLYPDQARFQVLQEFWKNSHGTYHTRVWDVTCKDGSRRSISWSNISRQFPVEGWASWGIGVDVTELKFVSEQLSLSEAKFRMMLDSSEVPGGYKVYNELIEHREYLHNVAKVSELLLIEQDFNLALKKAFSVLGCDPGVDTVFLYELIKEENEMAVQARKVYKWCKPASVEDINDPDLDEFAFDENESKLARTLLQNGPLNLIVRNLPQKERDKLEQNGVHALLIVPVFIGVDLWGFIGFSNRTTPELYSESEIAMLQSVALSIGGAIQREMTNRELLATKQKAEEMNRLKNNFLANMSHELRTPLIGIIGYAEILVEEAPDPGLQEMAGRILSAGQRLSDSLSLILDISRIEADRLTLNLEQINVEEIINESVKYIRRDAELKDLRIILNIDPKLPGIRSDRRMLIQIMDNLLSNAIKFTRCGGITLNAKVAGEGNKYFIKIEVEDTGIGIAPDSQEYIFKEFRQGSEGLDRDYEGLGLGLTIVKKFTEKLGGKVELESTPGKGTKFTINLPVQDYTPDSAGQDASLSKPALKQILMVDDDILVYSVSKVFVKDIAELLFATNAEKTYEILETEKPDLIILDIYLRDKYSGYDILNEIRRRPELASVPVLAFTASSNSKTEKDYLGEGFDGFIPKPVVRTAMVAIINEFLDKDR